VLNGVHWVRPEMVVEVTFAEWAPEGLLRHVVDLGEREDKPAIEVRRDQLK
jgi:bifunctional non-homologous end joining protein LigD